MFWGSDLELNFRFRTPVKNRYLWRIYRKFRLFWNRSEALGRLGMTAFIAPPPFFFFFLFLFSSLFCCSQPSCVVWAFLFHKFSNFTPPPPQVSLRQPIRLSADAKFDVAAKLTQEFVKTLEADKEAVILCERVAFCCGLMFFSGVWV